MKISQLIIILTFFFKISVAQQTEEIEYDFIKKKFTTNISSIDYNKLLKIKIINLNPFLYTVKITADGKVIEMGTPNSSLNTGLNQNVPGKDATVQNDIEKLANDKAGEKAITDAKINNKKIEIKNDTTLVIDSVPHTTKAPLTANQISLIVDHNSNVTISVSDIKKIEDLEEKFNVWRNYIDEDIIFSSTIQNAFETDGKTFTEIQDTIQRIYGNFEKIRFYYNAIYTLNVFTQIKDQIINFPNVNDKVKNRVIEVFSKYNIQSIKDDYRKTCIQIDKFTFFRFNPESSIIDPNDFDELKIKIEIKKNFIYSVFGS